MATCIDCNKRYQVKIDLDNVWEPVELADVEIPFCPFCGIVISDIDEGQDEDDELDV